MDLEKWFLSTLLGAAYALTVLVHAQDQSGGFISIDCGLSTGSSYTDARTGLNYVSDANYIDAGISKNISSELQTNTLDLQYWNVRSFPQGIRNCYTLPPPPIKGDKYLIRVGFMYGNYDAQNQAPTFDLHLGVNKWDTVYFDNTSTVVTKEILHILSSNHTYVCLVNTNSGTPFISVLELRPVKNASYENQSGSMALFLRLNVGSTTNQAIRYNDDIYDRIWMPYNSAEVLQISTSTTVDTTSHNDFQPPSIVMRTAVTAQNDSPFLNISWPPYGPNFQYYIYMHFAELVDNQYREFNISLNGNIWVDQLVPQYLSTTTAYTRTPANAEYFEFSLQKTQNSTLPPLINAMEIYVVKEFLQSQTDEGDVNAIMSIKSTYGVNRNSWQGDPCAPQAYSWDSLNCSYEGYDPPRIISLNLSSSGLSGEISSSISNLKLIQYLDLSNNSLTGPVPAFLSQLPSLMVLNLTGNKLTGSVPVELVERSKNGSLILSVGGNPNLCSSDSCQTTKKNIVAPVVGTVAALFVLLTTLAILWSLIKKRKQQVEKVAKAAASSNKRDVMIESKNQFTYSEILSLTNNFERVLGKGGFGTVYHGLLDDTQVAVKMLSSSSIQGYKQFHAEVNLLMRVHHRNLTSLIGYCDEGDNMGLIYEYMAKGNLQEHLSDRIPNILSWDQRLCIAIDAAQGLEYLHSGCKPPIVHRDVKSTNILLNEKFQAKVADFGLSRVFPIEEGTHVSTVVAGTPGYLDPEYYVSNRLNEKSDVFGFGVVLLEIITSQPAITRNHEKIHISKWVSDTLTTKGDVRDVVDLRLRGDYDINSVWKAVEVAMACVLPTSIKRPTMSHVVMELKQCLAAEIARKEGYETESKGSIEMVSLNLDTELVPLAR